MVEESIEFCASLDPDAVALRFAAGPGRDSVASWTYEELLARIRREAAALELLVPVGLPVAIAVAPRGPSVAALIAALTRRNPAILLPGSIGDSELRELLGRSRAAAVFVESSPSSVGWRKLEWPATSVLADISPPVDVAIAQLTSGSMGPSRLALRAHAGLALEIAAVKNALGFTQHDSIACMSAISHSYGLLGGLLAPLRAGATVALARSAADLSVLALRPPPTILFGLASTYSALLGVDSEIDLTWTRWALSAGAALPDGLFDAFQTRFQVPIRQDYGTTETGTISIDIGYPSVPDTVGRVLPHLELRVDDSASRLLGGQDQGEILVRGTAVAVGYLEMAGVQSVVDADGWYHTRDLGSREETEHLRVGRRVRDPIELPGMRLHPESIEALMTGLSGVLECVALPTYPSDGLARLRIVVVAPDLDEPAIRDHLQLNLPEVEAVTEIALLDALPRSPAGKILQKYLL